MGLLYGRAGRLTAQNGGFRRGQCQNGGTAHAIMLSDDVKCECASGFHGNNCQLKVIAADCGSVDFGATAKRVPKGMECQNGGTCTSYYMLGQMTTACACAIEGELGATASFTGDHCEIQIGAPAPPLPCDQDLFNPCPPPPPCDQDLFNPCPPPPPCAEEPCPLNCQVPPPPPLSVFETALSCARQRHLCPRAEPPAAFLRWAPAR
jgi:hypothetical protein